MFLNGRRGATGALSLLCAWSPELPSDHAHCLVKAPERAASKETPQDASNMRSILEILGCWREEEVDQEGLREWWALG